MKRFSLLFLGALTGALVCLAPHKALGDDYDKKTVVTISAPAEAPGIILQPGTYVIKLLNSSSNRHIAEIMNERMDHLYALTFTVAAEKITPSGKTVLTFYEASNGRPPALRKWFWPGDTVGQEFIYPKDQAARISAATKERVPEGKIPTTAESGQSLVADNANGLSLEAADKPKETEVTVAAQTPEPSPAPEPEKAPEPVTVIAQNAPPPQPQRVETPQPANTPPPAPVSVAANDNDKDQTLPQTASNLPLIGAVGMVSLALAFCVGFMRRRRSAIGL
jgi:LPXTG-motif cell wall-anchored protein